MSQSLHIVCLDAPSPPDYGGAYDLFYKIPELAKTGKKIILHYFNYKPGRDARGLEEYCSAIYSYPRGSVLSSLISGKPYIVHSRINKKLIERLNADEVPVLLEGIHCAGLIPYLKEDKKIVVRIHNNEAVYYKNLAKSQTLSWRKIYFIFESFLLKRFQKSLKAATLAYVSTEDATDFKKKYNYNGFFIPCFLPWQTVNAKPGKGSYCLYHGNLLVSENRTAVEWLIKAIGSEIKIPIIFAGRGANKLKSKYINTTFQFIDDPTDLQLHELIRNAHINILPSMNQTGIKLKLLHALFDGRFCITNIAGIKGSGLPANCVQLANDPQSLKECIRFLFTMEFTQQNIDNRKATLQLYNNEMNAKKLSELL